MYGSEPVREARCLSVLERSQSILAHTNMVVSMAGTGWDWQETVMLLMVVYAGVNEYSGYIVCYAEEPPFWLLHPVSRTRQLHLLCMEQRRLPFLSPARFHVSLSISQAITKISPASAACINWYNNTSYGDSTEISYAIEPSPLLQAGGDVSGMSTLPLSLMKASRSTKTTVASIMQANRTSGSESFTVS